ncbi:MAG: hypothetical protein ACI92E_001970 [Oceanicoccus sp.]|jgi:hypothetical protein
MQIRPSLLLFMLVVYVFAPSIYEWATHGGAVWYRPYELWLLSILVVYWGQRRKNVKHELPFG